jgi:hypothetical protein
MRINGRTLRPSTLAERRLMLSLGVTSIRVPRHVNPYSLARRIKRAARLESPDHIFSRSVIDKAPVGEPVPSPAPDRAEPLPGGC